MSKTFVGVYNTVIEKDEHKKSKQYKKLSPKMKDAVDLIFKKMESKPSDFLNTFEKTIKEISKKFKVPEKEVMGYFEKDEHRKSRQYKKLSPRMRDAVDQIFKIMDSKPSDFLNTFEKTIQDVSKKFKVLEKDLMNYFEQEMLSI
jgi:predicted solute-binding protein